MSSPTTRKPTSSKAAPGKTGPGLAARVARGTGEHPIVASPDAGMYSEPLARRWVRRAITIPGLCLAVVLYGLAMPLLMTYGLVRDLLRGRRSLPLVRFHLFIFGILLNHVWGLLVLCWAWFRTRFVTDEKRWAVNVGVEHYFIPKSIGVAERVYGMEIETDNLECCFPGPILLLSRHASILDTIMPIKILGEAHGMGMRIVQKEELLWNPLVDVASSRMPRAFIKRGTGQVAGPIADMKHLLKGITDNEAFVVFPEGSRFSEAKKNKIISKIAQSNPAAAEQASLLKHTLPPRPAGTLALLEDRPDIDVVFMAHTGLESANRLEDFVAGALYKRKVKMKFWRVPAAEIPKDPEEQKQWLHAEWSKMDAWVDANRDQD